jgi:hypothetical protein
MTYFGQVLSLAQRQTHTLSFFLVKTSALKTLKAWCSIKLKKKLLLQCRELQCYNLQCEVHRVIACHCCRSVMLCHHLTSVRSIDNHSFDVRRRPFNRICSFDIHSSNVHSTFIRRSSNFHQTFVTISSNVHHCSVQLPLSFRPTSIPIPSNIHRCSV